MAGLIFGAFLVGFLCGVVLRSGAVKQRSYGRSPLRKALDKRGNGARAELARALNVEPTVISRWANREVTPLRFYREQIAEWLGMKEETLWPTT